MVLWIKFLEFFIWTILIVFISKNVLVKILRRIGELLKLKAKTIGNIAGIATSIPELLTASFSAINGFILTSTYNILSSNIINMVQYMFTILWNKNNKVLRNKAIRIDISLVLLTIIIPIFMKMLNIESQIIIVPIFVALLILFYRITHNAHKLYGIKKDSVQQRIDKEVEENNVQEKINKKDEKHRIKVSVYSKYEISSVVWQAMLLALVGIILYVIGNQLSSVLEDLCVFFNVPEFILGILLGFITSIPELITFFESQRYNENEREGVVEATSNLLTSNMMNLFVIQSVAILLSYF